MAGANANDPLKVIALAFKEIDRDEFNELLEKFNNDIEQPGFREYVEQKLIYIGTFGLHDEMRQNALACVELIKFGKELNQFVQNDEMDADQQFNISQEVNVRMLSGDHIETCR
jgi:magnesium-transporting ATPase (P-type)